MDARRERDVENIGKKGEETNLKQLRCIGTFVNIDFQTLIEEIFEEGRQLLPSNDLRFAIRGNQIQSLEDIKRWYSKSFINAGESLTLKGLSFK